MSADILLQILVGWLILTLGIVAFLILLIPAALLLAFIERLYDGALDWYIRARWNRRA
jgi:hypothetical protein